MAALLTGFPSAALAGDREARRHVSVEQHRHHDHAVPWHQRTFWRADQRRQEPTRPHGPRYARGVQRHRAAYHCGPCGERFRSRHVFDRHVHRRHRIPLWALSHRDVRHRFGWFFHR
jgi:hypothetical protein